MWRWLLVLALAGCKERTELMIGVATDLRAPDALDEAQLVVSRADQGIPLQMVQWQLSGTPSEPFNLPGSYGVFSEGEEFQIALELQGFKNGTKLVTRRAVMSLVEGQTLFYRMTLVSGCMNKTDCGPTESCIEGACAPQALDSQLFPEFTANLVTELTCASGTNYIDTATNEPMPLSPTASTCPNNMCSEGTCLVPPDMDTPSGGSDGGIDPGQPDAGGFGCNDDLQEPNDTTDSATSTPFGADPAFALAGLSICPAGDLDHFRFVLPSTKTVEVRVDQQQGSGGVGAEILNAGGSAIGSSVPSGPTEECVCLDNLPSGQYFVRVSATGLSNYRLDMKEVPAGQCACN